MSVAAVLFCSGTGFCGDRGADISCVETEGNGCEVSGVLCYIAGIRMVRRKGGKGRVGKRESG